MIKQHEMARKHTPKPCPRETSSWYVFGIAIWIVHMHGYFIYLFRCLIQLQWAVSILQTPAGEIVHMQRWRERMPENTSSVCCLTHACSLPLPVLLLDPASFILKMPAVDGGKTVPHQSVICWQRLALPILCIDSLCSLYPTVLKTCVGRRVGSKSASIHVFRCFWGFS